MSTGFFAPEKQWPAQRKARRRKGEKADSVPIKPKSTLLLLVALPKWKSLTGSCPNLLWGGARHHVVPLSTSYFHPHSWPKHSASKCEGIMRQAVKQTFFESPHAVTYTLILLNGVVFALTLIGSSLARIEPATLFQYGALYPDALNRHEYWRFIAHAFLHANVLHLALNMLCIAAWAGLLRAPAWRDLLHVRLSGLSDWRRRCERLRTRRRFPDRRGLGRDFWHRGRAFMPDHVRQIGAFAAVFPNYHWSQCRTWGARTKCGLDGASWGIYSGFCCVRNP